MGFNEKGFIITVDAFLGITLIIFFIVLSFFYLSHVQENSWNLVDSKTIVADEAAVLEKTGIFASAVSQGSSDPVSLALNSSAPGNCFEVTVFSQDGGIVLHSIKSNCTNNSDSVASVERAFVVRTGDDVNFYIARTEGWPG